MIKSIFKTFVLSVLVVAQVHFAYAQTASILPPAKTTFVDANGKPLVNGKVEFYIPGSGIFKTTWQDAAETIPNLNPVILDAAGRALILGSGSYRQVVKDRNNNVIWDQVTSSTGSSSSGGLVATGDGDLVGTIKPWAGSIAPNQYMMTYGQEISRATYATLYTAIVSVQPVFCNSGSPILNGLSDTNSFWIGMTLEVSCLGAGFSTVISKTSSTVTMAANANITTNTNASFFPWGRGNGTTTFNLPDYRGQVLAGNNIMGGVASNRITTTYFGVQDPNSAGAAGGTQNKVLGLSNQVPYTPAGINSFVSSIWANFGTINVNVGGAGISLSTTSAPTFAGTPQGSGIGSAASATIAAGGSAYPNGSLTLTVSGGTCTTQPTFTATGVAGAITAPILLDAGLCSVAPANPASTTTTGVGTGGTLTVTYTQAPISLIQPTRTVNYIIKVTPDDNSATASGVTALGGMTGSIACGPGTSCTGNIISASIPPATSSTLGGVLTSTCSTSNWFNSVGSGTGVFACTQPNFTDLLGAIAIAQIPNNLITYAKLQQGAALSLLGVAGNAGANLADIIAALDAQVLRRTGATVGFGSIDLANTNTVGSSLLALANGGCNALLAANNGGILWSDASKCQILAGTATARFPLLSGSNATPVWGAFTLPASVTSGGVACFSSTSVMLSSTALAANGVVVGGGAGACPGSGASQVGINGQVFLGVTAGGPQWGTLSQDCTITSTGVITCTKTNNVAFGTAATVNTGTSGATIPLNNGNNTFSGTVNHTGPFQINGNAQTFPAAAATLTQTIANGTSALGTGAITSGTCATVVTTAATNTATTDVVTASFNGDPTAITGYIPSTAGMLTIIVYPTANNVNFKACNNTAGSITPGAITLNWRVVR